MFLACLFVSLIPMGTLSYSALTVPLVNRGLPMPNLGVDCVLTYEQYSALMGLLMSDGARFAPTMYANMYPDNLRIVFSGLSMEYVV